MNFTETDIKILVAMTLAVLAMSITFPTLGLAGEEAEANDIPEFNTTKNAYDFAGQFPDRPGGPSRGQLIYQDDVSVEQDNRQEWLYGDTSDGHELVLLMNGTKDAPAADVHSNNWTDGNVDKTRFELTNTGDANTIEHNGYKIQYDYRRIENKNESDVTLHVQYTIEQQPSEQTWYQRIPVLGGVVDTTDQLVPMLGWIGSVIYWYFSWVMTLAANMFTQFFEVITFVIDLLHWLYSTYFGIVDAAPGWASLFVMVPGVLMFLEFAKGVMIAVDLIWIG